MYQVAMSFYEFLGTSFEPKWGYSSSADCLISGVICWAKQAFLDRVVNWSFYQGSCSLPDFFPPKEDGRSAPEWIPSILHCSSATAAQATLYSRICAEARRAACGMMPVAAIASTVPNQTKPNQTKQCEGCPMSMLNGQILL